MSTATFSLDVGVPHLEHHRLAGLQPRHVDLADRPRSDGVFRELVEQRVDRLPEFLLDQLADHLRRVGGHAVLEVLQFLGQADADQVGAGAEHLPKLDRRRPELLNRQPQTDLPTVAGDRLSLMRLEEVLSEIGARGS